MQTESVSLEATIENVNRAIERATGVADAILDVLSGNNVCDPGADERRSGLCGRAADAEQQAERLYRLLAELQERVCLPRVTQGVGLGASAARRNSIAGTQGEYQ